MATKQTKDGLGYIIQAITNIIEPKVDALKYDKTYRAKVVEKIDIGIYKIEINRIVYQLKYDGDLEVGDIVKVKAPLNNFSDIYIETVPSHGGGTGGTSNYNELLNKPILNTNNIVSLPTNSEEIIKGTISLHKIAKTGKYSDLIGTPSIIDNLSSDSTTDALSAKQGRILNGYIKDNDTMITTLQEDIIATEDEINKIKNNYIPISQKGSPNGVATLNSNALLKDTQLPVASKNTLGAIKVGNNLTITNDGILNAVGGSGGVVSDTLPIGSTVEWYSNTIPDNWLLCNGQAVSRTDYPDLFAIIGTTYGEGDGANTFNLPNKKGRFALGLDTEDTDFNTLGKTGGEKTHQLTIEEMPAHDHELNELVAGHGGIQDWALSTAIVSGGGSTFVKAKGGNQPHNNMPPHIVVNYIIKAKQSVGVVATVVDNLDSSSTTDALSAKQGRILNGYIKDNDTMITTLQEDIIATEDEINKIKNNYIPISQKGSPNGVATLNSNALLKDTQLPVASKNTLGAIKVGNNLTITNDGILNAVGGSGGVVSDTLPIGSTVEWYSNTIPDNWLLCNGQAVSRTDYPDLFAIIGTTYGEGDGANTFNLPNKKGRFALGLDTEDTDFNTLGKTGGEKTHQLTIEEMPAHDHELNELVAGHGGIQDWALSTAIVSGGGSTFVKAKGGNQPHNNMPPHIVVNYIIKAKQSVGVVATVVDNLDSSSTTDALSAKQGKVLNEKLTALKTYNAEEIDTGEIWIDGKKIYRKVISFNLDNGDTNLIDLSSLNISEIFFDLSKSYYIWSQQNRIIPIISTNVDMAAVSATDVAQKQTGIYYNTSEQILHCEFGNARPIRKGIITIEYTKKTE